MDEAGAMVEIGLRFVVPWSDIKARLTERSKAAFEVSQAQSSDGKDPCHEGIRVAAERDATLFGLLAKYAPEEGMVRLDRGQIQELFMAQPFYGGGVRRRDEPTSEGPSW